VTHVCYTRILKVLKHNTSTGERDDQVCARVCACAHACGYVYVCFEVYVCAGGGGSASARGWGGAGGGDLLGSGMLSLDAVLK